MIKVASLSLEGFSADTDNYTCANCGRIEWFISVSGEGAILSTPGNATPCLACGATLTEGESSCPECSWSYDDEAAEPPAGH